MATTADGVGERAQRRRFHAAQRSGVASSLRTAPLARSLPLTTRKSAGHTQRHELSVSDWRRERRQWTPRRCPAQIRRLLRMCPAQMEGKSPWAHAGQPNGGGLTRSARWGRTRHNYPRRPTWCSLKHTGAPHAASQNSDLGEHRERGRPGTTNSGSAAHQEAGVAPIRTSCNMSDPCGGTLPDFL